jgi:hypothetical protein
MAIDTTAAPVGVSPRAAADQRIRTRPLASVQFDWAIIAASAWFLGGLYLDGWAHNTIPSLETFFTPWHAVLYSGFFATVAVLGWGIGRNRAAGRTWWYAIPAGYELSVFGGLLFLASGLGDMAWHVVFGIEANVEALLSPTHLLLLLGATFALTGPIRAAARRHARGDRTTAWPAVMPRLLALAFLLASLAFFTQYANPWGGPWFAADYRPLIGEIPTAGGRPFTAVFLIQSLNISGVLIQSALLTGFALIALRTGRVPVGGFTLAIGLYVILTVLMRQKYDAGMQVPLAIGGVATGVAADALHAWLRPAQAEIGSARLFGTLLPAVATAASLVAVGAAAGVWWTVHLWAGAVVLAAATGWLIAFLATPPQTAHRPA